MATRPDKWNRVWAIGLLMEVSWEEAVGGPKMPSNKYAKVNALS